MLGLSSSARNVVAAHVRSGRTCSRMRRALHGQQICAAASASTLSSDKVNSRAFAKTKRCKSTAAQQPSSGSDSLMEEVDSSTHGHLSTEDSEMISFPSVDGEGKPVLLNAQEHAVGYLSKILNARVYDAARESDLQHAKNLSAVRT